MMLVCVVDFFFENIGKSGNHKKSFITKISGVWWLSSSKSTVLQFEKNCTLNYFLQKIDFCIFEPQKSELIENSSKASLNFSPLKCTYLGKKFNIISTKSEKMKLKSGHLELRFSVLLEVGIRNLVYGSIFGW